MLQSVQKLPYFVKAYGCIFQEGLCRSGQFRIFISEDLIKVRFLIRDRIPRAVMAKISAIIIVKNGEEMMADCVDSLSFCDEIIVIDDNSTDRTYELATHLGAKVYRHAAESFAERRNFGLRKSKNKWILYIDIDERISPELRSSIE